MKYVIYARKSSEGEDRQAKSIEDQINTMKELAVKNHIEILDIYRESKSAKEPGRPVFNNMIDKINKGKADGILCWKLDRLARNPVDAGTIQWLLQKSILKRIKAYDREYNPEDNVVMACLEFGMANQYIRDLSANVRRGLTEKVRRGEYPGSVPVGYLRDLKTRTIIIDPNKWHYIEKAFRLYSTGLYSLENLAIKLNSEGFRSRQEKPVCISVMGRILSNPLYYGWFRWNGELCKGTHEHIVSKDIFDKVRSIMFPKKHLMRDDKIKDFVFRGFMTCGECGLKITAETQKGFIYYHCTKSKGADKCSQRYLREEDLISELDKFISCLKIDEEIIKLIIGVTREKRTEDLNNQTAIANKNQELMQKNRQSQNLLVDKFLDGAIPEDIYNRKLAELRNAEARLEENVMSTKENYRNVFGQIEAIAKFVLLAKELFNEGTPDIKKEIISIISSNIVIKDKKIMKVALNEPFKWLLEDIENIKTPNGEIMTFEHSDFALNKMQTAPKQSEVLTVSGCWESDPVFTNPNRAYCRYTTSRFCLLNNCLIYLLKLPCHSQF